MAIIKQIHQYTAPQEVLLNLYPDQFISDGLSVDSNRRPTDGNGNILPMPNQHTQKTTKMSQDWWKINMDYFYTVALAQYNNQSSKIVRNYELMKGHLTPADFYMEGPVMSLVDEILNDVDLPAYVKHYPILNPPIKTMQGEKSKRPDIARPKCVDADSQSEEGQFYTELFQEFIGQKIKQRVADKLKEKGIDLSHMDEFNQQVEELTAEKMQEYMVSYTTEAEVWANNMLAALKIEFETKEKFEGGFYDLMVANMEFFHNYTDRSRMGFRFDKENPKNIWFLTTPDKKYTRDAYAAGTIHIMELSEIIDKYELTEEEVKHLRDFSQQAFFPYSKLSNFYTGETGEGSIHYNAYDPAVLQERNRLEANMYEQGQQRLDGSLSSAASNVATFGNRFVVTTAYWRSKRKEGLLKYIDIDGNEQSTLVDDTYKDGEHPQQISIEWKWENIWYKGVKIGQDIYYVEPLEILDYCPIIGVVYEIDNTVSTSLVDLMKPFQTLYNICLNQIYRMLEKEKGKGIIMNKRHLPIPKGGSYEDAKQLWETEFEQTGVMWIDDSPNNMQGGPSNFNQFQVLDATLSDAINARFNLAIQLKNECWELVGINRERTGGVAASQTATGTNTAVSQSYAQTEPFFVQQEYIENQQLQAMLDIAQYMECQKPESTVSFIDSEGGNVFCKIQTEMHLKNRDIKLFMTSRADDMEFRNGLKELSQAALQNGASLYEVAQMRKEQSTRKIMDMLKKLKERNEQAMQQNQQMQQQAQQAEQQQAQAELQQKMKEHDDKIQVQTYGIDTVANTSITTKLIEERIKIHVANSSTEEPDMLDIIAQNAKQQESIYKRDIEQLRLSNDQRKIDLQEQSMKGDLQRKDKKLELEQERNNIEKKKLQQKPPAKKK